MSRLALLSFGVAAFAAVSPALAQTTQPSAVAKVLQDGYEVKAAFSDNSGGAYMVLQKGTSAYLCHSSPNQTCEKLN